MNTNDVTAPQPASQANNSKPIWELVIEDIRARDQMGRKRYGTPLQANNGRKALVDLYQELLDAVVYTRQKIEEDGLLQAQIDQLNEKLAWFEYPAIKPRHNQKVELVCRRPENGVLFITIARFVAEQTVQDIDYLDDEWWGVTKISLNHEQKKMIPFG